MKVLHVLGVDPHYSRMIQKYSGISLRGCDCVSNRHDAERFLAEGNYEGVYIEGLSVAPRTAYGIENGMVLARKAKEMGLRLVVTDVSIGEHDADEVRKIADRAITKVGDTEGLKKALKEVLGFE